MLQPFGAVVDHLLPVIADVSREQIRDRAERADAHDEFVVDDGAVLEAETRILARQLLLDSFGLWLSIVDSTKVAVVQDQLCSSQLDREKTCGADALEKTRGGSDETWCLLSRRHDSSRPASPCGSSQNLGLNTGGLVFGVGLVFLRPLGRKPREEHVAQASDGSMVEARFAAEHCLFLAGLADSE